MPELVALGSIYRKLCLIRRVEEEIARIYPSDKIKSPVHLSIGQEAIAVGVCSALQDDDVVSATYRGHATYLAKGGNLSMMLAELYGKATGCAGGKGGSMHLVGMDKHILGCSAVVGTTIPISVGYALALKREGSGRVVASFFGDGATEEGVFYESLNFAALHRLPMLFVCENNSYAIHTPLKKRWATTQLCERVRTYGITAISIADSDVLEIRRNALEAIENLRRGETGPVFLECHTYRWREHVGPNEDYQAGYRSVEELLKWKGKDQVEVIGAQLQASERATIDAEIDAEIAMAIDFAEESAFPSAEEVITHVYAS
ncbi:MAG: thiamine pyrophosphate-dependent dehydrogenase E1 component subunit alpha [Terracidiphilus sp.]